MGPKAYRNISHIFTLPTKRTLNRLTQNINFKPGLNKSVIESLSEKVCSFSEINKNCVICLDEMSIKSHLFYDIGRDSIVGFVDYGDEKLFQNREKMKVYLAAQVLSATVAAGMNTYVALQTVPSDAVGTIEFIELFDKLFDILNSSKTTHAKEYNRAYKGQDYQEILLKHCLAFFGRVQVCNSKNENITHKIKSLRCFKLTINGLLLLWKILHSAGFEYLLTRRLCQDAFFWWW